MKTKIICSYIRDVMKSYWNALTVSHDFWQLLRTNVGESFAHIPCTFSHHCCYDDLEKFLTGKNTSKWHDVDKIVMYVLFPWIGTHCISNIHTLINSHHPIYEVNGKKHEKPWQTIDWKRAIIDWECARFTEASKQLDAYDTFMKYYNTHDTYFRCAINAMIELGLYYDKVTPIGRTVGHTYKGDEFLKAYPRWRNFLCSVETRQ